MSDSNYISAADLLDRLEGASLGYRMRLSATLLASCSAMAAEAREGDDARHFAQLAEECDRVALHFDS